MNVEDRPSLAVLQQAEQAMTPGDWQWFGNTKMSEVYLATVEHGRTFVMDFARWGMRNAQPRFQVSSRMVSLAELGKQEHSYGPKFEAPHRRHFTGIGHPDPNGIVILRNAAPVLLEVVAAALAFEPELAYVRGPSSDAFKASLLKVRR
jgi:hypothetical protein